MTEEEVEAKIEEAASKPKSTMIDGISRTNHSIPELIALDNHERRKTGHAFGFRIAVMTPPEH